GQTSAGLVRDSGGNLYGTTELGGSSNDGVVFKVDIQGDETVLYSFTGGADGGTPIGGLLRDSEENLYGTTYGGGAVNYGVVFKVSASGEETVLHSFEGGTTDGCAPYGGLVRDGVGNLYGTTDGCGAYGSGTIFRLSKS